MASASKILPPHLFEWGLWVESFQVGTASDVLRLFFQASRQALMVHGDE